MKYTEEELIEELKRVSEEHCDDEAPKVKDIEKHSKISYGTYYNRFGSWDNVLEQGKFSKNRKLYSDDELIQEFWRVYEEKCDDKPPTTSDMRKYSRFSENPYITRFGSWDNFLRERDFVPHKNLNKKDLINIIKNVSKKYCNGKAPKSEDIDKKTQHSSTTYNRLFGSWNKALKEAGFSPNITYSCSEEEIIEDIKRVSQEYYNGDYYSLLDYKNEGKYSHKTPINKFGSWRSALEASGIDTDGFKNYSKEAIKNEINRVSEKFCGGKPPREVDMDKYGNISHGTCQDRFGSWKNAVKESGFKNCRTLSGEKHPNWKGGISYYGESWYKSKKNCLKRDGGCRICEEEIKHKWFKNPDVHHITPVRYWKEEEHEKMNHPRNLISLCRSCHAELEGKFKGRNHEEFEELAKDYLDIDETEEKRSVFDY